MTDTMATKENNSFSSFDNEGFYYINNTHFKNNNSNNQAELTFKQGEIVDIHQKTICPGEIHSIMDYEEFEKNKDEIQCYRQVLKGKKIRFYRLDKNTGEGTEEGTGKGTGKGTGIKVMISQENVIYPDNQELMMTDKEIMKQVNFSLLQHNKCYYATIINDANNGEVNYCSKEIYKIILTYVTNIDKPTLKIPQLALALDDSGKNHVFKYHANFNCCSKGTKHDAMHVFKTELNNSNSNNNQNNNGIIFYRKDGQPFEFWTPAYSLIKCQEKPYNIPAPEYYIMLLNHYPTGNTYSTFFQELHYDVDIYLEAYPEHRYIFELFETKLDIYATLKVKQITNRKGKLDDDYDDYDEYDDTKNYDELKIKIIKQLLNLDCDEKPTPKRGCSKQCNCASAVPCNIKLLKTPEQIITILNNETNAYLI